MEGMSRGQGKSQIFPEIDPMNPPRLLGLEQFESAEGELLQIVCKDIRRTLPSITEVKVFEFVRWNSIGFCTQDASRIRATADYEVYQATGELPDYILDAARAIFAADS